MLYHRETLSPHSANSSLESRPLSRLAQGGHGAYEREKYAKMYLPSDSAVAIALPWSNSQPPALIQSALIFLSYLAWLSSCAKINEDSAKVATKLKVMEFNFMASILT